MNNIPVFISTGGTATLILREIPYSHRAFILLREVTDLSLLLQEATVLCQDCGADAIFVSSEDKSLHIPFPHVYDILRLHVQKASLPQGNGFPLVAMSTENDRTYMKIYNQCFDGASHALHYDVGQLTRIYRSGHKAFLAVSSQGDFCGIGELHENELAAIALLPEYRGNGFDLALSLMHHCPGPEITLTVASDNHAALALYDKLGFRVCETESSWYQL